MIGVDRSQIEAAEASLANLRKNRGSTLYGVDARNATIVPQEYERIGRALKDPEQISKVAKELYEKKRKLFLMPKLAATYVHILRGFKMTLRNKVVTLKLLKTMKFINHLNQMSLIS